MAQYIGKTVHALCVLGNVGFPESKRSAHFVEEADVLVCSHFELIGQAFLHRFKGLEAFSDISNGAANLG